MVFTKEQFAGINPQPDLTDETGNTLPELHAGNVTISVWDEDEEHSILNILNNKTELAMAMKKVPDNLKDMDTFELRETCNPSPLVNQLRLSFWREYDRSMGTGTSIRIENMLATICSKRVFRRVLTKSPNVAWILTPPQNYADGVRDVIETCLHKMRMALTQLDISDTKDLSAVLKIYEAFDKRVHGDYVQKHEHKHKSTKPVGTYRKTKILELGDKNVRTVGNELGDSPRLEGCISKDK